jgi:Transposase
MKRKGLTIEFKRAAVARMLPGVKLSTLAQELGICRQRLYEWREAAVAGDEQLRRPGRPKHAMASRAGVTERGAACAAAVITGSHYAAADKEKAAAPWQP